MPLRSSNISDSGGILPSFASAALTSAETFEFLARLHGGTEVAYRDALVERFQLDTRKKVRARHESNRRPPTTRRMPV